MPDDIAREMIEEIIKYTWCGTSGPWGWYGLCPDCDAKQEAIYMLDEGVTERND